MDSFPEEVGSTLPIAASAAFRIDLGSKAAECADHGPYTSQGFILRGWSTGREIWSGCPGCERERVASAAAARAEMAAASAAAERDRLIGAAAIPPRFRDRTFDGFVSDSDAKRRALTVCRDYAEQFAANAERGAGLVLAGLPGTGKSHLAAGILHSLIGRYDVRYTTCMQMIRLVRDTWRKDSETSEMQMLRTLGEEIDLLVIDEVGASYGTEGEQTLLFEVMDRRYGAMRPTILLTNQDKDGFRGYVGDRVFDRLRETSRWVVFDWPSYRPTARASA